MHLTIQVDQDTDHGRYLIACARLRNISMTGLMFRLIDTIARDQLVVSVLDDAGREQEPYRARGHRFRVRHYRKFRLGAGEEHG
jgi:hypothetical protein